MLTWLVIACSTPEDDRIMVVFAARDLSVAVPIQESDVYALAMEPRYVPEGAFVYPGDVIGRVPMDRILANEPIRARRLADPELQAMLEALVPRGHEVSTIKLDARADRPPVAGEDKVDVHASGPTGPRVLLSGLSVLRVDRDIVAVIATPEQAEVLKNERLSGVELSVTVTP